MKWRVHSFNNSDRSTQSNAMKKNYPERNIAKNPIPINVEEKAERTRKRVVG